MRHIKRCILKNWLWVAVGLVLTRISVETAYMERGYVAYGGEWLTLPLTLMAVSIARDIKAAVKNLFGMEDYYEPDGD